MSYADIAAYRAAVARGRWFSMEPGAAVNTSALWSGWPISRPTETAPTTAAVPARLSLGGSFGQPSGNWRLAKVRAAGSSALSCWVVDRLSHQGGLDGTVAIEQTTNLPTAALTRYTDGEGVFAGLEVHAAIGATQVDVSINYTNTTPTSGRTSEIVRIGGTALNGAGVFRPLPLQAGDTGVTSVEGLTLGATTGTAGAFGVVLYKPLTPPLYINPATENHVDFEYDLFLRFGTCPLVLDGACLTLLATTGNNNPPQVDVFLIPE